MPLLLASRPRVGDLGACSEERHQARVVDWGTNDSIFRVASFVAQKVHNTAEDVHRPASSCHQWVLHSSIRKDKETSSIWNYFLRLV